MSNENSTSTLVSWLKAAGIPLILITTLINLSVTIYEKSIDRSNQEHYLKLASELEREKELLLATRRDCSYMINETEKLSYQRFDLASFYTNPLILDEKDISEMIDQLLKGFQINYITFQKIKGYLKDSETNKIESYLKFFSAHHGRITHNYPMRINIANIIENGIGYANIADYVIRNELYLVKEDTLKNNYKMSCLADLFYGIEFFPYFLTNVINSHIRETITMLPNTMKTTL